MVGIRQLSIAIAASLAWLSSGCSVALMTPAPSDASRGQARPSVECTSSNAAPIVDTVLATYQLVGVGYAATLDDSAYDRWPISRKTDMAIGAGFAAVFIGSAIYGYVAAAHCRRVKSGPPQSDYVTGVSSVEGVRLED